MRLIEVGGIELEVHDVGTGDRVVLVQTALTADELAPLAEHLVARGPYRAIVCHRRGYASSSPVQGPGSVVRDAADCRDLIEALGLDRVHVVGYSYSGAVGLQLAVDAAQHVQTLTLIEPPPVHVPSSAEFRPANARLQEVRRARGPGTALEEFLALVIGPHWRTEIEQRLPGAAEQMQRDTTTFFDTDLMPCGSRRSSRGLWRDLPHLPGKGYADWVLETPPARVWRPCAPPTTRFKARVLPRPPRSAWPRRRVNR